MLAGCAVGPDFERPPAPNVTGYTPEPLASRTVSASGPGGQAQRFDSGLDLPGEWWKLFHSKALTSLVETALEANPDLQAAQAALRVARENVHAQQGALLPSADGNFAASRQKVADDAFGNPADPSIFNLFTGQLNVSYTPDVFGGTRRSIESLEAQADAQRFQLEATYLTLTSNLAGAAVQEASLRGQIAATRTIIKIATDLALPVYESDLARTDLYTADEAFLTGTAAELVPVRSVDDRELGDPGPLTKKLSEVFWSAVKGDLEGYRAWNEYVG